MPLARYGSERVRRAPAWVARVALVVCHCTFMCRGAEVFARGLWRFLESALGQAAHLGGEPVALLRGALFPMIFAEWGLPHTLQAYPSRSKACRFSLLQDAQRPQGEDLFKPAGTANCCPIPLPSKPYSFVFSLESFSRMNASISGALARIRSHCSL